jgi:hypothetical protein
MSNNIENRKRFENQPLYENRFVNLNVNSGKNDIERLTKYRSFHEKKMENERKTVYLTPSERELQEYVRHEYSTASQPRPDIVDGTSITGNGSNKTDNSGRSSGGSCGIKNTNFADVLQNYDFIMEEQRDVKDRYIYARETLINIDSRDRNKAIYPFPNHYKIDLPRHFSNIKRISLESTEFPNSSQLIRSSPVATANNKIKWTNANDATDAGITYTANITPGNYQPSSLATEIETQMNLIPRNSTVDPPHQFRVSIDSVTDITTFSSYQLQSYTNVFSTTTSDKLLHVTTPVLHAYHTGDIITVSGASSITGVNSNYLNGQFVITVNTPTEFTYPLPAFLTLSETSGVGGNVEFAEGLDFKLYFSDPNSPAFVLGFDNVDTDFKPSHSNTVIANALPIKYIMGLDGGYTAITLNEPMIFPLGEDIRFQGINAGNNNTSESEFNDNIITILNGGFGYKWSPLTNADETYLKTQYNFENDPDTTFINTFKIPIDINGNGSNDVVRYNYDSEIEYVLNGFVNSLPTNTSYIRLKTFDPIITSVHSIDSTHTAIGLDGQHNFTSTTNISIVNTDPRDKFIPIGSIYNTSTLTVGQKASLEISYPSYFNTSTDYSKFFVIGEDTSANGQSLYYRNIGTTRDPYLRYDSSFNTSASNKILNLGTRSIYDNAYLHVLTNTQIDSGYKIIPISDDVDFLSSSQLTGTITSVETVLNVSYVYGFGTVFTTEINTDIDNHVSITITNDTSSSNIPTRLISTVMNDTVLITTKPFPYGTSGNAYNTHFVSTTDRYKLELLKDRTPSLDIDVDFKVETTDTINATTNTNKVAVAIGNGQIAYVRTINRPINLAGDDYVFMTSPQLNSMENTGTVRDVFAKMQLAAPPGTTIYNSYIHNPKTFEVALLTELFEMEFNFVNRIGNLIEFNDVDHSFTLRIIEYVDKLKYNEYDSRRGRYDLTQKYQ